MTVALVVLVAVLIAASEPAAGAAATPLSADVALPDIASTYGSGVFGQWTVDSFGLPAYRYTMDEEANPLARQPNLSGSTDAWSQVGNTRVKANAYNHGYTQLWSQDRLAQWTNYYDAAHGHFSGGFGYVNVDGKVFSTLYDDRPASATTSRTFGVGYYAHSMAADGAAVSDVVFAPFGNDPVLVHQVTISNTSSRTEHLSWFEYWDDNPYVPDAKDFPRDRRTDLVGPHPDTGDGSGLHGRGHRSFDHLRRAGGWPYRRIHHDPGLLLRNREPGPTSGGGGRPAVQPDGRRGARGQRGLHPLRAAEQRGSRSRSVGDAPVSLGSAHPGQIPGLVAKYRAAADPFTASEHAWVRALPKLSVAGLPWLGREFLWDGYLLRSATVDEEVVRRPHHHPGGLLPVRIGAKPGHPKLAPLPAADELRGPLSGPTDPRLRRPIPAGGLGQLPYGSTDLCQAFNLGQQDDSDFWLMLAASQYALVTRDFSFFDRQVRYYGTSSTGSLWDHIKLAFEHQQSLLGPHGEYQFSRHGRLERRPAGQLRHDRVHSGRRPVRLRLPTAGHGGRPGG